MPETQCSLIPDSLFAWYPIYAAAGSYPPRNGDFLQPFPEQIQFWDKVDLSEPYICIGGGALASSEPEKAIGSYVRLVQAVKELGYQIVLTENDSPDSFLHRVAEKTGVGFVPSNAPILMCGAVLAHARLFISGRYHPSIFASLGGTPCIFLGSHAHKMASLSRLLRYEDDREFGGFPNERDIAEIILIARKYIDQGEALRSRVSDVAKSHCEAVSGLPAFLQRHMNG
jgi:hypothetical protein